MKILCKRDFNWRCPDKKMLYCSKGDELNIDSSVAADLISANMAVKLEVKEVKLENKELAIEDKVKIIKETKNVKYKKKGLKHV